MAVQRIPKELRYKGNEIYEEARKQIADIAKERANVNKKRVAAKKKKTKIKKASKTLLDTREYKKLVKEINRKTEIYGLKRTNYINKIKRTFRYSGLSVSAKTLGFKTARQLNAEISKEMKKTLKEFLYLPFEMQKVMAERKIQELEEKAQTIIDYYEVQIEEETLLFAQVENFARESEALYIEAQNYLTEGLQSPNDWVVEKANTMMMYSFRAVNQNDGSWMKIAMRMKRYLPDIRAVIDKYLYDSDGQGNTQEYNLYDTTGTQNGDKMYECWNKVMKIFNTNVFKVPEFEVWERMAREGKVSKRLGDGYTSANEVQDNFHALEARNNATVARNSAIIDLDFTGLDVE